MPRRYHFFPLVTLLLCLFASAVRAETDVDPERFEKRLLVPRTHDPMQLELLPDGSFLFIERGGAIKRYDAASQKISLVGRAPSVQFGEVGLMGIKLDAGYLSNGRIYLFFCPEDKRDHLRLSRFEIRDGKLASDSERIMLEYPIDPDGATHMGGGMAWDRNGNLYIGTGDNCVPIPQPPLDQRPGHEKVDALRSSGNTQDLRGKVLRIHPEEDGSYTIPPGNLFRDPAQGRGEIYAMGVRNAFRIYVDPVSGWLYWGDVGPNVRLDLDAGPNGYDEVNQAKAAGNFGWPMFVGPNEAYRRWDFAAGKGGDWFDLEKRINDSKNNTGIRVLPPAEPAWIWYPTTESKVFPELGSGGRSAMAGPIYHYDEQNENEDKLPASLDGKLLIYDWTRNWIKAVTLDEAGAIEKIDPFLPQMIFRKPIDLKFHRDGTLYLIEYGDKWGDNHDAQIVQISYPRGNRAPQAVARTDVVAGKQPLTVNFDAGNSFDKDGDPLEVRWEILAPEQTEGDSVALSTETSFSHTFTAPGTYRVNLAVRDPSGAVSKEATEIRVGNAEPQVEIIEPAMGSFFTWEEPIRYRTRVRDLEDGDSDQGEIEPERVVVRAKYQQRRTSTQQDGRGEHVANDEAMVEPGLALMRRTTCFACHMTGTLSAGPAYAAVATRYRGDSRARTRLAKKIITGGMGIWGNKPMPPHPQHTLEETEQMVDWILSLASETAHRPMAGSSGAFRTRKHPDGRGNAGVYEITASYTDDGAEGASAITGKATHVLHARMKKAGFFDTRDGVELIDEYEGEHTIVGHFADGDYVSFKDVLLAGIEHVTFRAGTLGATGGQFELRADAPDGELLATAHLVPGKGYQYYKRKIIDPGRLVDLYLVARAESKETKKTLGLNWLIFHDSEAAERERRAQAKEAEAILAKQQNLQSRPFVRDWQLADVREKLDLAEKGRSFENGKKLFQLAQCNTCHRMGEAGGRLGPDLTQIAAEFFRRGPEPRLRLIESILEPSAEIADRYRVLIVGTEDGKQASGIVVKNDTAGLYLANNPQHPEETLLVPRDSIEWVEQTEISLMPAGLLSTFTLDDIMDLIAYLESGGKASHPAFSGS
ncbi:MAG: PQQ-dependent sugar dehydrogenase [Planctomycetota bacterium]|nr:PQQ-dependent sugar dehydrogenase [Planctomycetota bacterium]